MAGLYHNDNPENPVQKYKDRAVFVIDVSSVVLQSRSSAQVHFTRSLMQGGQKRNARKYIATIAFGFDRATRVPLKSRWENPTGFYVSSYRLDEGAS